jgi:pSer/pThr/pTyr-binding forkhead associated (FHA) protein
MNGRLGDLMPTVFCTSCGEANPDGARYCAHCGTPLMRRGGDRMTDTTSTISIGGSDLDADQLDEADADAAAVAALPPGTALLAVRRGPNAGSRFLLDRDLTLVGRHPDSDIFLDDVTVSRRHAEFYRQGARFTVRDVGSLNGTYVNRERIEEATLNPGDEVQVGKFRLVFLLGPGSAAEYGGGMQVGG